MGDGQSFVKGGSAPDRRVFGAPRVTVIDPGHDPAQSGDDIELEDTDGGRWRI
jgi:hypothetical protein